MTRQSVPAPPAGLTYHSGGKTPPTGRPARPRGRFERFVDLTPAQRSEAIALRPKWPVAVFKSVAFWLKADGHVSRSRGHHRIIDRDDFESERRLAEVRLLTNPARIAVRGDLSGWRPGITYHFSTRDPVISDHARRNGPFNGPFTDDPDLPLIKRDG
jgi:hypothetical protein